jgi:hypothetical protein
LVAIDLLFRKISTCEMENRRLRHDVSAMRGDLQHLRAARDANLARGLGSPSGPGFNADCTIELACACEQRRFAVERRKTAEAALGQARGELQEATTEIARQRALFLAAEARLVEQVTDLRRLRLMEEALQRFRERRPWLVSVSGE